MSGLPDDAESGVIAAYSSSPPQMRRRRNGIYAYAIRPTSWVFNNTRRRTAAYQRKPHASVPGFRLPYRQQHAESAAADHSAFYSAHAGCVRSVVVTAPLRKPRHCAMRHCFVIPVAKFLTLAAPATVRRSMRRVTSRNARREKKYRMRLV